MKNWIFGAITVGCMALSSIALACPTGTTDLRPIQPRPVQNVSFQASELVDRASRLETAAVSHDQSARAFEQEADTLAARARILRNQAQFVSASDRPSMFDIADELALRANVDRNRAEGERAQASELRIEARALRNQALQLVRVRVNDGGGGWRTSPRKAAPTSTPLPTEGSTLTL